MKASLCAAVALLAISSAPALAADDGVCSRAASVAGRRQDMSVRVLSTIATVESGRQMGQRTVPWPWTINVDGIGYFYNSKQEVIDAVRALQQNGSHSIDVGCMQINLNAHPQAFASLEAAFDPAQNADYAARFLRDLVQESGQLGTAMTDYHSRTPSLAADYARRIVAVWPEAAALGLGPAPAPDLSPYTANFAHQFAADHERLQRLAAPSDPTVSKLQSVSAHGAAWPGATPAAKPNSSGKLRYAQR